MRDMKQRQQGQLSRLSRRRLLRAAGAGLTLAGSALTAACRDAAPAAREASPTRVYRIGWLADGPPQSDATPLTTWPSPIPPQSQRFVARLAELGYVEGRTLHWEWRRAATDDARAAAARELVELGVDLILITGAPLALRAAFEAPGTTPVVMGNTTGDPVGQGYAQSLARPGGRLTGVAGPSVAVLNPKRVELFKEALPTLTRLGVVIDVHQESAWAGTTERVRAAFETNGRELGIEVVVAEVRALEELDGAFATLADAGVQGVFPLVRAVWYGVETARRIVGDALRHRLPMIGLNRLWVEVGALIMYDVDVVVLLGRTAEYVDMVLRGARPGDLTIENPSKFDLVINHTTADTLGLTIPPAVIARATEVIR